MAAARHNLSRRAVLGAGAAACALPAAAGATPFALSLSKGSLSLPSAKERAGLRQAQPERESADPALRSRWNRALAAYRRAESKLTTFRAQEASLPPSMREWPHSKALDRRFGDLDCARLRALKRLLRVPAPDLAALSLKIDLIVDDEVAELAGGGACLAALRADARRLAHG